jgi:hypothetical protein
MPLFVQVALSQGCFPILFYIFYIIINSCTDRVRLIEVSYKPVETHTAEMTAVDLTSPLLESFEVTAAEKLQIAALREDLDPKVSLKLLLQASTFFLYRHTSPRSNNSGDPHCDNHVKNAIRLMVLSQHNVKKQGRFAALVHRLLSLFRPGAKSDVSYEPVDTTDREKDTAEMNMAEMNTADCEKVDQSQGNVERLEGLATLVHALLLLKSHHTCVRKLFSEPVRSDLSTETI